VEWAAWAVWVEWVEWECNSEISCKKI